MTYKKEFTAKLSVLLESILNVQLPEEAEEMAMLKMSKRLITNYMNHILNAMEDEDVKDTRKSRSVKRKNRQ